MKSWLPKVVLLATGMFALGLDAYVLAGLLPGVAADFHHSIAETGQIVTAFTLSYAFLSPLLAAMSATLDRRSVLIGGLLVFALANIGSILAPTFGLLMGSRVLAGAAAGLYSPSAAATAAGLVPSATRGKALAIVIGGLTAATVFGVPLGLLVAAHFGWRAALLLVTVLALVAAAGIAIWLPRIKAATPSLGERLSVLSNRAVLGRVTIMLFAASASLGLYTFLAPVLMQSAGVTSDSLPGYFFLWGAAGLVGNAAGGWLLDRGVPASRLLTGALTVLSVALLAFPFAGVTGTGAAVLLVLWGASVWSLQVPLQHQLSQIVPEHAATAIALLASSIYLGSALGSGLGAVVLTASVNFLGPAAALSSLAALVIHTNWPINNELAASTPPGSGEQTAP